MSIGLILLIVICGALGLAGKASASEKPSALRPPAVPLVVNDPYFSVWSFGDRLTDSMTRHWTGSVMALTGMVRIDGKPYRFIGTQPEPVPAMAQVGLEVLPTRSIYHFEEAGIRLDLTFMTPALPDDLDVLARPLTYLAWDMRSTDGKSHDVSIYVDATSEWTVNTPNQSVEWASYKLGNMEVMRVGTHGQPILQKQGDDLRIDWGHLYLAIPNAAARAMCGSLKARNQFAKDGTLPAADDLRMPRPASDEWPVLAGVINPGKVGSDTKSGHLMLAYDDQYSIEYLNRKLRPYWRRSGMEVDELLENAERDYPGLKSRCEAFDRELMQDMRRVGGDAYAQLCSLSYRQCLGAHKLVADADGTPLYFSKENLSGGCMATVDVTYPSAPFFMLLNPALLKGMMTPILEYASGPRWKHPYAPHDIGFYPLANGQVYGGGERTDENQMPVEECGNMLILLAALAKIDGNADYASKYWPLVTQWAEYLHEKGLDPENQLCTDDFAGHLAHNTNLSIKAIMGLAGYSLLCDMAGKKEEAASYRKSAQEMAHAWVERADDGDHYRLAFDKPGTWSQKYNLVWDRLLGFNLFPKQVAEKEIAFYKAKQDRYGLALDNRKPYTTVNWIVWSATLAESEEDFNLLLDKLYLYANETPDRIPFSDWYWVTDGKLSGFRARSVVGGVYIKALTDPALWAKWNRRAGKPTP